MITYLPDTPSAPSRFVEDKSERSEILDVSKIENPNHIKFDIALKAISNFIYFGRSALATSSLGAFLMRSRSDQRSETVKS
jgi:hypothetical protein